jgi:hypothetical protein
MQQARIGATPKGGVRRLALTDLDRQGRRQGRVGIAARRKGRLAARNHKAQAALAHGGDKAKLDYLRKLKRLGVVYDTPYAGEMMDLLKESRLEDTLFAKGPFKSLQTATDMAQKFYQYGDDFWKIMGFENEKAMLMKYKGLSEADAEVAAAERIRNTYPTYSMVGRAINKLRRFPLAGTFVSFPAEIIRTTYHQLRYLRQDFKDSPQYAARKVVGLALASAGVYALQGISRALLGLGDDEDEALRELGPDWQQNSNLMYLGRDEDGNVRYMDLSFLDPYNMLKRPVNAMMRNQPTGDAIKQSAKEFALPFVGEDILFGAVADALMNRKDSGARVFNPSDTPLEQALAIEEHLRKQIQPGAAAVIENNIKAWIGARKAGGAEYSKLDEMAAVVGFRISTSTPKSTLANWSSSLKVTLEPIFPTSVERQP